MDATTSAMLRIVGMLAAEFIGTLILFFFGGMLWIRFSTKGKIRLYYVRNGKLRSTMVPETAEKVVVNKGKKGACTYTIDPRTRIQTLWPGGFMFPEMISVWIDTYLYKENSQTPFNLTKNEAIETPNTGRIQTMASDEGILKAVVGGVRDSMAGGGKGMKLSTSMLAVLGLLFVVELFNGWQIYALGKQFANIFKLFGGGG